MTEKTIATPTLTISNCIDCPNHEVINDRDPSDWFCDDDVAVVCTKTRNPTQNTQSKHASDHSPYRAITVACRPYQKRKESEIPDWCPL